MNGLSFIGVLVMINLVGACASNPCHRKTRFFENHCAGSDVVHSPDPLCEHNLKHCSPAKLQAFRDYVACIEAEKACSLEALGRCQEKHPGGVNLQCPKRDT